MRKDYILRNQSLVEPELQRWQQKHSQYEDNQTLAYDLAALGYPVFFVSTAPP
jgi:hypothetical protein